MIDNLAETLYELPETRTLIESHNQSGDMAIKAYYYPTNAASYTGNPEIDSQFYHANKASNIGLLYTWAAATNGVFDSEYGNAGKPAKPTKKIQGICPDGWHVPSDYDWGVLEKEMADHPALYSSVTTPTRFVDSEYWRHSSVSNWYGQHSTAMKSECPAPGSNVATKGKSSTKGFNILLVGFIMNGNPNQYGHHSFIWASTSIRPSDKSWYRGYQNAVESSGRDHYSRSNLHSVRCKKQ